MTNNIALTSNMMKMSISLQLDTFLHRSYKVRTNRSSFLVRHNSDKKYQKANIFDMAGFKWYINYILAKFKQFDI